tara:strand:+ start:139 stop:312 length:174 start_codon:yes stop_codon:yes gene_type:complete
VNSDLETFNYFVDDLLSSNVDLLKYELDIMLMQYLFKSTDLELLKNIDIYDDNIIAS